MSHECTNSVLGNRTDLNGRHHPRDIPIYDLAKHDKGPFDYKNIAKLIQDRGYSYR